MSNITQARSWSATAVRLAIVLVVVGIALLIVGGILGTPAGPGMIFTGVTVLSLGVIVGLVGVVRSWFRQ